MACVYQALRCVNEYDAVGNTMKQKEP